jgi:hypothetical protein
MKKLNIMMLCIFFLLFSITIIGCTTVRQVDPCEREYTECVHECGEGILSGICKEGCTYERSKCQEPNT